MDITEHEAVRLARMQLAFLQRTQALPKQCRTSLKLGDSSTPLLDIDGRETLLRVPLLHDRPGVVGYADIALVPDLGTILLSLSRGKAWDEQAIRSAAARCGLAPGGPFVAYAYPRVGLGLGSQAGMQAVYDWPSGKVVVIGEPSAEGLPRTHSFSLVGSLPENLRSSNRMQYEILTKIFSVEQQREDIESLGLAVQEDIRYSRLAASHPCFELRYQHVREWCVPASVEMLLAFYRYDYEQEEIARELGQEDSNGNQSELAPGNEYKVVEVLSLLTRAALQVRMYPREGSFWAVIKGEISADRPLILFSGAHSRVVTGYSESAVGAQLIRALTLYDPAETEVCWEYYNPSRELVLFSAALRKPVIPALPPRSRVAQRADPASITLA